MAKKAAEGNSKDKPATEKAAGDKPAKGAKGGAKKAATKNEMLQRLAEASKLSKKQVADVLEGLTKVIEQDLSKKGPGIVTIPGLLKLRRVEKKATKDRPGRNPATGEVITIKGKPKSTDVRARVLKSLKESVK